MKSSHNLKIDATIFGGNILLFQRDYFKNTIIAYKNGTDGFVPSLVKRGHIYVPFSFWA